MSRLVLRHCQLQTQNEQVDIAIDGGRIVEIAQQIDPANAEVIDCGGRLVTPPFVESHIHLDSVLAAGQPRFNESGTLFEGIQIWGERKTSLTREDVQQRALAALKLMAQQGVLYVRTHVDVTEPRLIALDALLELREQVRDWMTVQIVAFPQDGIYSRPENESLLEEALRRGADAVGGIPHYELTREDGVRSIGRIFDLAEQYNKLIDVHCDEIDDEQARFVEVIVAEAIKRGGGERVSASHTTAFGSYNDAYAYKLMGFLHRTNVNFIANPLINITLQGRMDTYPKRRGLTRIKELVAERDQRQSGAGLHLRPLVYLRDGQHDRRGAHDRSRCPDDRAEGNRRLLRHDRRQRGALAAHRGLRDRGGQPGEPGGAGRRQRLRRAALPVDPAVRGVAGQGDRAQPARHVDVRCAVETILFAVVIFPTMVFRVICAIMLVCMIKLCEFSLAYPGHAQHIRTNVPRLGTFTIQLRFHAI